jgi:zinc protease
LVERKGLPVVCSTIWYRVGSRDERSGETGLSHFLEHMMFKGTARYAKGEIDMTTSRLGGHNNAFTSNDMTAYYFNLAADRWQTALEIEASRMGDCLLDGGEFAAEKQVVLEELAMGEDDPDQVLYQAVEAAMFTVHPYHHPVIGWKSDLLAASRDDMAAYYRRHYSPDRACIVAAGQLDADSTLRRIDELFGSIPAAGVPRPEVAAEPAQRGERRVEVLFDGNLPRLAIAYPGARVGDPDDFALDVLATILATGKSSRLYQGLVHGKELLTSVSVMNEARYDPGLFLAFAECKASTDPLIAEHAVLEELERTANHDVSVAEIRRAQQQILAHWQFEQETALQTAMRIGRFEVQARQGHELVDHYTAEILAVDKKRLRDVAERVLSPKARTVGILRPETCEIHPLHIEVALTLHHWQTE